MHNTDKVEKILQWRESLTLMNDNRFFEIMRTFLGSIQTPYNKPDLIEKLSAIFRKSENQKRIISYLSESDIKILTLIRFLNKANQEKILDFFSEEFTKSSIYSILLNLNERLIIFFHTDSESQEKIISINPLLQEALENYLNISNLVPQSIYAQRFDSPSSPLSPIFVAAFISYIRSFPEMCKNNLSIKKKNYENLEKIFDEYVNRIPLLLTAFSNLGLITFGEKEISINDEKLEKFAKLPLNFQLAYLSVASVLHLSRGGLRLYSQLVLDLLNSIPNEGLSKSSLKKLAFLLSHSNFFKENLSQNTGSTFSKMLQARRSINFSNDEQINNEARKSTLSDYTGKITDGIVDSAIGLGLFTKSGLTENEEEIYIRADISENEEMSPSSKKGLLNINAGTNIMLMPGFTLLELLPLTIFMTISKYSIVSEFEINKKTATLAFDKNFNPDKIFEILEKYTAYEIPQNLKMNISEWYSSYSSAILFKGYVLKVDEKTSRILEKNPNIKPYIQEKLADGVYLLNIPNEQSTVDFIKVSGLDSIGNVKIPKIKSEVMDFPLISKGRNFNIYTEEIPDESEIKNLLQEGINRKIQLKEKLKELQFSKQIEDALLFRIDRGIILNEEQLRSDSVRVEILEVDGMNYAGKVRLVENAISANEMIELEISTDKDARQKRIVLGRPLSITKQETDALVKIEYENGDFELFSIGKANRIKLIKTSVFN